ncbi:SOUL heme-binding protein [Candidatus Arcanobacter lacustris]|uniref:SOUL heme-binding protein n=1 Tax=Candidatus Arcanibacter lacustris TaxID=1607817 RepID=A0A0F5MPB1_9RICK|nr:SOUL heme-binding protein [Candidatus Arcanobacter lacustris]KKB96526.1 SOUL heme-binding protein [Candidatus Arcanobacter lacustris]
MINVENPEYTIIEYHDQIELRDYDNFIVAQVMVKENFKTARSIGFKFLAHYISGDNIGHLKIAMTAPVMQQKQENAWNISFVMPGLYSFDELPKPFNNKIKLLEIPQKIFVVIRFSGLTSDSNIARNLAKLKDFISEHNFKPLSQEIYAFYNPPWTLPFLRRNEIMVEIQPQVHDFNQNMSILEDE